MVTSAVVAVDQGTTATKAALVSCEGEHIAFSSVPVSRYYPQPGWVEQDPEEIWASVVEALGRLPEGAASCLALAAQRESVVVWDRRSGTPLSPCVSWQCNRGADICAHLVSEGGDVVVRGLTGLPLEPMFSAPKLAALLHDTPGLRSAGEAGRACAGTVDSWLAYRLSGGTLHVTDPGNASRTLLFDIERLEWSQTLLEMFDIPAAMLPRVVPTSGIFGETAGPGPFGHLPMSALAADSHAALFGLGCLRPGAAKATYGTGTSLALLTGTAPRRSSHGLATTVAWQLGAPSYALEGNIFSSGATVEWVAGLLGLRGAAELEELAWSVPSSAGVHLVPAFCGLGAPHWRPRARGQLSGLTFSTRPSHVARAALESVAFQVADLVRALQADTGAPLSELHVDGGASANEGLMQLQADLAGCPVVRTAAPDAATLGAAFLGGLAVGVFDSLQRVEELGQAGQRLEPSMAAEVRTEKLSAWDAAVSAALSGGEPVRAGVRSP